MEEEKIKLNEEIKRLNQKGTNILLSEIKYSKHQKNIGESINSDKNKNDFGRLSTNMNISPKKEIESLEGNKINDNNMLSEKSTKFTFKKKSLNKSPSLEAKNALTFKKLFNEEKNSNYEEESIENNNNENNSIVLNYKNRVNILMNNNCDLTSQVKNLNNELENIKLKETNLELINSNLIKENIELKQAIILIKDNYEKEYSLVTASLINLTEKYQQIKKDLKEKNKDDE